MTDFNPFPQPKNVLSERIFELFLFVNPLGHYCYCCEKEVLAFIKSIPYKVHIHVMTFHNFNTVTEFMNRNNLNHRDLSLRNEIYSAIYDASLSYKAALLQGKKMGRDFLIHMQKQIHKHQLAYSPELLHNVIDTIGLDKEEFFKDKTSNLVKLDYERDQRVAQEMNVRHTPSLVIFDTYNKDYGILLDQGITKEQIHSICFETDCLSKIDTIGKEYVKTYPF